MKNKENQIIALMVILDLILLSVASRIIYALAKDPFDIFLILIVSFPIFFVVSSLFVGSLTRIQREKRRNKIISDMLEDLFDSSGKCDMCGGTGYVDTNTGKREACERCDGSGVKFVYKNKDKTESNQETKN